MDCHRYNTALSGPINNCANCHPPHNPVATPPWPKYMFDNHVDGRVTINFDPIYGPAISYSGTPQPGDGYGNCANTYCHSNGTSVATGTIPANTSAEWGADPDCSGCHGNPPAYANGAPKKNSHAAHGGSTCDKCHSATTTTGTTITSSGTPATLAGIAFINTDDG